MASDDIARLSPIRVSPATVRKRHVPAYRGRLHFPPPTFRRGVSLPTWGTAIMWNLLEGTPELPAPLRWQIHQRFSEVGMDVETWTQRCAAVLSHLTETMAIVTVPRASAPRLKHIQMV